VRNGSRPRLTGGVTSLLAGGHSGTALSNGWRFKPESVRILWKDVTHADVAAELSILTATAQRASLALAA
jgi:hypothetical protein